MNIPTQPPQGVMAELRELQSVEEVIAALRAGDRVEVSAPGRNEWHLFGCVPAHEVLRGYDFRAARTYTAAEYNALLARCEGLEAERDIYRELHEAGEEERSGTVKGYHRFRAAVKALDSRLAATRTPGGDGT